MYYCITSLTRPYPFLIVVSLLFICFHSILSLYVDSGSTINTSAMSQVPNARRARGIRVHRRYQSEASPARPTASPSSQAYSVFRRLEAPRSRVRPAHLRARLRQDFSPWPPVLAWVQFAQPLFHRLRSSAFRAYLVSRRLEAAPPVSKPGAHGGAPGPPRLAVREACKAGAGGGRARGAWWVSAGGSGRAPVLKGSSSSCLILSRAAWRPHAHFRQQAPPPMSGLLVRS